MQHIPNVDRIADGLYIGGARAAHYAPELRQVEITNVLKLYHNEPEWPHDFHVCNHPLNDGEFVPRDIMMRGVSFIQEVRQSGRQVLVTCGAGISRSSTFVLAYLLQDGHDLHAAWRLLRQNHPEACPALQMWASLLAHYQTPYTIDDVVGWWFEEEFPLVQFGDDSTPIRRSLIGGQSESP